MEGKWRLYVIIGMTSFFNVFVAVQVPANIEQHGIQGIAIGFIVVNIGGAMMAYWFWHNTKAAKEASQ